MIKMSKPIEFIENGEEKDSPVIAEEFQEGFNNLLKTIKNLNDSGFLSLLNAISANYKYIIDTLYERLAELLK